MGKSKLVRLWEGKKDLPNLKYIDLSDSNKLMSTPDFNGLPNLETLNFVDCKNLVEIHSSVAVLKRLKFLWLYGCESIKSLPSEFEMDSLEILSLGDCSNLKKIPEFGEHMKNLWCIYLNKTAIEDIPSSIGHLVGLKELYLDNCKNLLTLPMTIFSLKSLERLGFDKSDEGSDAKARDGFGFLRWIGLGKSHHNPPRWGLVLSSLNRLCSLRQLSLRDCELYEGDIPDDIGCLSFLEQLNLSGNIFVSLPESIRCLSKLSSLDLERCKSLQELPPLPSKGPLRVHVRNCTSLKRLLDPSKMMSRYFYDGIEFFCYDFFCLNNIALAQDGGWINTMLSTILKFATQGHSVYAKRIVIPGSEIPGWFSNQSVGHSINVDLPPPSCTNWLGIAFCVVFQDPKQNLSNPATLPHCDEFKICSVTCIYCEGVTYKIGSLMSEHLWVFYLDREQCLQEQFLFETYFGGNAESEVKADLNMVKKCGAHLVYKQDLEELSKTLKILK